MAARKKTPSPKPARGASPRFAPTLVARALERVRALCLEQPETTERESHGAPSFFIGDKKMFVSFLNDHHGDGKLALWCAAPPGMQEDLVRTRPERFFVPAYVGHLGWVGVGLDGAEDWETVARCIREAWLTVAPKALGARRAAAARAGDKG